MAWPLHLLGRVMRAGEHDTVSDRPQSAGRVLPRILLLRWVLIIATCYLVVFSPGPAQDATRHALFVLAYFASNLVLSRVFGWFPSAFAFGGTVVLLDTCMVSIAMALGEGTSSDFYIIYFVVLFLSALTERLELIAVPAVVLSLAHLSSEARLVGIDRVMSTGYLLRVPFLLVVGMFFYAIVQETRTRERAAEEQEVRRRRLEALSGLSHDLRTPVGAVQLLTTLLLEPHTGSLNDLQTDFVRRIQSSMRHLNALTLNVVEAARIEAGELCMRRAPTDLGSVVEHALLLWRNTADLKDVTVECTVEPGLPLTAIDPLQMERVTSNLVGNAIKYTNAGGHVRVSVRRQGMRLVLAVNDDGPGIPRDELQTAFEKYQRGSQSGSMEGSGLGLFIVKAIVDAHGGTIDLSSTVGVGTTATITLGIGEAQQSETRASAAPPSWRALPARLARAFRRHATHVLA